MSPFVLQAGQFKQLKNFVYTARLFSTAPISTEIDVAGRPLRLESGRLAKMADGSAIGSTDGTSVLVTAVCKPKLSGYGGFLPLTVDYRHKWSAAGRIPTNYHRRDLGPSEFEILTSRMIDRSVRPLFSKGFGHDLQLTCSALSLDQSGDPVVAAINAASAALLLSDVPWRGPVAAVRLACDPADPTRCIVNPTRRQLKQSPLNAIMTAAAGRRVIMLDVEANDLPMEIFARCIEAGLEQTEKIVDRLMEIRLKFGKPGRETLSGLFLPDPNLLDTTRILAQASLMQIFDDSSLDKLARDKAISGVKLEILQHMKDMVQKSSEQPSKILPSFIESSYFDLAFTRIFSEIFRRRFFETGRRCDGRTVEELRPIKCWVDLYDSLHGSAVFQRGQTQVLCTLTLDSVEAALRNDAVAVMLGALKEKLFMLTYEFPPFANNELGGLGGASKSNRREMGHGSLSERALRPLVPDDFAFATRLSCQVMESNGSSSMASVCAGSLALMDGGVPIKAPAAGVAVGLLTEADPRNGSKTSRYRLLADINGLEDYTGDMDFKIAGTKTGLTALQLDVKRSDGLSLEMVQESLEMAHRSRNEILGQMARQGLSAPRPSSKPNGPAVEEMIVPINKRHRMMRMGGYSLRKLESDLGVQVTQLDNQTYRIFAQNKNLLDEAKESIKLMLEQGSDQTKDLEFGAIYKAKIVEILERGICVTLSPEGDPIFVPNTQLDIRTVRHASALNLAVGQTLLVKYFGREPTTGAIRLSRKILLKTATDQQANSDNAKNFFTSNEKVDKKLSPVNSSNAESTGGEGFALNSPWSKKAKGQ